MGTARLSLGKSLMEHAGIELSESRLRELANLLHAPDPVGRRLFVRVPVEGFVMMQPLAGGEAARKVGVYDLSRGGIALVDDEPMPGGMKFNLRFPREVGPPAEILCTARHSRRMGEAYIIGAEFGVSWLAALVGAVAPPPPMYAPRLSQ